MTIYSLARVKTFYSLKSFPKLPSQSLLTLKGGTRLRDEIIKLETRNITVISWSYRLDAECQSPAFFTDPASSGFESNGDLANISPVQGSKRPLADIARPPNGRWVALLDVH